MRGGTVFTRSIPKVSPETLNESRKPIELPTPRFWAVQNMCTALLDRPPFLLDASLSRFLAASSAFYNDLRSAQRVEAAHRPGDLEALTQVV